MLLIHKNKNNYRTYFQNLVIAVESCISILEEVQRSLLERSSYFTDDPQLKQNYISWYR